MNHALGMWCEEVACYSSTPMNGSISCAIEYRVGRIEGQRCWLVTLFRCLETKSLLNYAYIYGKLIFFCQFSLSSISVMFIKIYETKYNILEKIRENLRYMIYILFIIYIAYGKINPRNSRVFYFGLAVEYRRPIWPLYQDY